MIFVTVGTTYFDALIREMDRLAGSGVVSGRVVCQYGSGQYIPKYTESFRFEPSIEHWLDDADLVVCHGGSTVLAMLQKGKRFVAIANTDLAGDHQSKMLASVAQLTRFPWSHQVKDLQELIEQAKREPPPRIHFPHLADTLRRIV